MPLDTDAWAYLNINNPICAWAAYRGTLHTPPKYGGFISLWAASVFKAEHSRRVDAEMLLEVCREKYFPFDVSRLKGMFCFRDLRAAEYALGRARHFKPEYLAELSTWHARRASGPYDGGWLDYANDLDPRSLMAGEWCRAYWQGEPSPISPPLWETLIEGDMFVLGTALRDLAYSKIKTRFPDSVSLLEISRMAAWIGSSMENVSAFVGSPNKTYLGVFYCMDMRDAREPIFLEKLRELIESGHPVNWSDIRPQLEKGLLGSMMDLRPLSFLLKSPILRISPPYGNLHFHVSHFGSPRQTWTGY